ncbi:hypothetical protein JMJ77_0007099 [Colletotrichum scovillei]|uniref:Uncharacterized protein n=1 Tax=Colletotrichum scovillei TaxID=1209932 RepID=A0A9P7UIK1_9PEZI|nr:hypothetical protein JMJ77_0007099 [Colletotrichum scovillei]KAG7074065.1 hypothetical protein JMJ76_0010553 [Colletotrichum scovillei]KAG7081404.1 hypothetical protein JMJ78_0003527 [Colletotrichum scovillei]
MQGRLAIINNVSSRSGVDDLSVNFVSRGGLTLMRLVALSLALNGSSPAGTRFRTDRVWPMLEGVRSSRKRKGRIRFLALISDESSHFVSRDSGDPLSGTASFSHMVGL